jgi:hypothetical protein
MYKYRYREVPFPESEPLFTITLNGRFLNKDPSLMGSFLNKA